MSMFLLLVLIAFHCVSVGGDESSTALARTQDDLLFNLTEYQLDEIVTGGVTRSTWHRCGFIDSCVGRCGSSPKDSDSIFSVLLREDNLSTLSTSFVCFCDSHCKKFNDCCYDYTSVCEKGEPSNDSGEGKLPKGNDENQKDTSKEPPNAEEPVNFNCLNIDELDSGSLWVREECHHKWTEKNVELLCRNLDARDDISTLLVQGEDRTTYRNVFCAECNFMKRYAFWILDSYCYGELPYRVDEDPKVLSDYLLNKCVTKFRIPLGSSFRHCLDVIDTCPSQNSNESWRQDLEKMCTAGHKSYVTTNPSSGAFWETPIYSNVYCAQCNGISANALSCPTRERLRDFLVQNSTQNQGREESLRGGYEKQVSHRVVTNYNTAAMQSQCSTIIYGENGIVVPILDTCEDGKVFDPYVGKCRQLYCGDGYELVKDMCVPQATSDLQDVKTISELTEFLRNVAEDMALYDEFVVTIKLITEAETRDNEGVNSVSNSSAIPLFENLILNHTSFDVYISPVLSNSSQSIEEEAHLWEVTVTMVVDSPSGDADKISSEHLQVIMAILDFCDSQDLQVYINDMCLTRQPRDNNWWLGEFIQGNMTDLNYLLSRCKNGNLSVVESSEFVLYTDTACHTLYVNSTETVYDCTDNYIFGYDPNQAPDEQNFGALICDPLSPLDPYCERLRLNESEYSMLPNGSVVAQGGQMFDVGEYFLSSEGLEICNNHSNVKNEEYVIFFDFSTPQIIMACTGMALSSICLFVTLATYILFDELRTLPGLNLMSLMFALLAGNILFVAGITITPGSVACQITAILLHYFFLARVFWTNAVLVHAFRTFGPKIHKSVNRSLNVLQRQNSRSRLVAHVPYAVYAWGTPLVLIILGTVWNQCACGPFPVYYGVYFSCWIGDPKAFTYLFLIPLSIFLVMNAALYIPTVCNMTRVTKSGLRKGNDVEVNRTRCKLSIYAKLSTATGFCWFLGVTAVLINADFLWYIFILFLSLEGFFIFYSFFCTRRVKNLYSKRFFTRSPTRSSQTNEKNSGIFAISGYSNDRKMSQSQYERYRPFNV
ncbi:uncharacterized protein [Diadema setosum]|uniref:uncharacterized protein n=1 Tax=Diadema setosum TaxID=31175 RepID=UPI003B3A5CB6